MNEEKFIRVTVEERRAYVRIRDIMAVVDSYDHGTLIHLSGIATLINVKESADEILAMLDNMWTWYPEIDAE